jgi:polyadenylate-binding protein
VHVRDVHESVTEGDIAEAFADCGDVADCRLCADPQGGSRYAFVAFHTKLAARAALAKSGEPIGGHPVRVVLSRTSVVPVNPSLLPQTSDEVERCARTIYVANVDRGTSDGEVLDFFTTNAGPVFAVLLQENPRVASKVAFVEFGEVEGVRAALKCGGRSLNGKYFHLPHSAD